MSVRRARKAAPGPVAVVALLVALLVVVTSLSSVSAPTVHAALLPDPYETEEPDAFHDWSRHRSQGPQLRLSTPARQERRPRLAWHAPADGRWDVDGDEYLTRHLPRHIFRHLGQYSPRFSAADHGEAGLVDVDAAIPPHTILDRVLSALRRVVRWHAWPLPPLASPASPQLPPLPRGCSVDVVVSLERHGARHLTPGALRSARKTLAKLQRHVAGVPPRRLPAHLRFLRDAELQGTTNDLVPYGALQAWLSGLWTAKLYPHLARHGGGRRRRRSAFVRATGDVAERDDRVVLTAAYWSLGFRGARFPAAARLADSEQVRRLALETPGFPAPDVVLSERAGSNNTLDVQSCGADRRRPSSAGEKGAQRSFGREVLRPSVGRRLQRELERAVRGGGARYARRDGEEQEKEGFREEEEEEEEDEEEEDEEEEEDDELESQRQSQRVERRDAVGAARKRRRVHISYRDVLNIGTLCSFDTLTRIPVRRGRLAWGGHVSPWCGLLRRDEWRLVGEALDAGKYYGSGYGNPYHRARGEGYVRELVARLTGTRPSLDAPTSLNATLDADPRRFPLPPPPETSSAREGSPWATREGEEDTDDDDDAAPRVFFDGSHDNTMASVAAALRLFEGAAPGTPPPTHAAAGDGEAHVDADAEAGRGGHGGRVAWRFERIAPLQGKLVFERVRCQAVERPKQRRRQQRWRHQLLRPWRHVVGRWFWWPWSRPSASSLPPTVAARQHDGGEGEAAYFVRIRANSAVLRARGAAWCGAGTTQRADEEASREGALRHRHGFARGIADESEERDHPRHETLNPLLEADVATGHASLCPLPKFVRGLEWATHGEGPWSECGAPETKK